ncbi:MAG: LPP20 family lipoprotein [Methylobacter sp.]
MNIKFLKPKCAAPVLDRSSTFTPSLAIGGLTISLLMTGCTAPKAPPTAYLPHKTLSAKGYGTVEKSDRYSRPQIKLMAMRASKMDAYRSLAEQLNGIQLHGQTTVGDMEVNRDNYQVNLNAYLRGARIVRTSAIGSDMYAGDDTFETVVELDLTPRLYECLNGPSALMNQCLQQNTESSAPSADDTPPKVSSASSYANTKGFSHK